MSELRWTYSVADLGGGGGQGGGQGGHLPPLFLDLRGAKSSMEAL